MVQSLLETTAVLSQLRAAEILDPTAVETQMNRVSHGMIQDGDLANGLVKEALGLIASAGVQSDPVPI